MIKMTLSSWMTRQSCAHIFYFLASHFIQIYLCDSQPFSLLCLPVQHGESALLMAVREGHLDMVKMLVQVCRELNLDHTVGQYHMDLAEDHHHEHLVEYLSSEFPTLNRKVGYVIHILTVLNIHAYLAIGVWICNTIYVIIIVSCSPLNLCVGTSATTDYVSQRVVYIWWSGLLALMSCCMYCIVTYSHGVI